MVGRDDDGRNVAETTRCGLSGSQEDESGWARPNGGCNLTTEHPGIDRLS
jgi:hypothetical protein